MPSLAQGDSRHFTPLRYPGGKAKLAPYVKALIRENDLADGVYVEPYAGGAAIALELLLQEHVSRIYINDINRKVYAFWKSVLQHTDELCDRVMGTPCTIEEWDRQKLVYSAAKKVRDVDLGFATFFLNRTNRSGIFNAGMIGGRDQRGSWKIDARYNRDELVQRIRAIANMRDSISVQSLDALEFLNLGIQKWPRKTLIYLDPPYYVKGRDLYYHFYKHADHERVAGFVKEQICKQSWLVSYDNVPEVRGLYEGYRRAVYDIGYSAREVRRGSEIMFFSDDLMAPELLGPVTASEQPLRML